MLGNLLDNDLIEHLRALEESLWIAETRFDAAYMGRVLSPHFFEFGCSGRIYRREETLAVPAASIQIKLPLSNFAAQSVADNVVLVTYISQVGYDDVRVCNRSSLWIKTDAGWQLRFHQGTPV